MSKIETYPLIGNELTLSGKYWVGDPCYVFSSEDWDKLCYEMFGTEEKEKNNFDDRNTLRVIKVDDEFIYSFGTAYGDGEYPLIVDGVRLAMLGVDAGMLAIVPIKLLKKEDWNENSKKFGKVVHLNGKRNVELINGNLYFGDLSIITDDKYDDPDIYDEYGDPIE